MAIGDVQSIGGGGASNLNALLNNRADTQKITPRESLSQGDEQRRIGSANQSDLRTQNSNSKNSVDNISSRDRVEISGVNNLDNARVNRNISTEQPNSFQNNAEDQQIPSGARNSNVTSQADEKVIFSTTESNGIETPDRGTAESGTQVQTAPASNPQATPTTPEESGVERTESRQSERISSSNSQTANESAVISSANFGISENSQVGSRLDVLA